jgi:hypothetical protein
VDAGLIKVLAIDSAAREANRDSDASDDRDTSDRFEASNQASNDVNSLLGEDDQSLQHLSL